MCCLHTSFHFSLYIPTLIPYFTYQPLSICIISFSLFSRNPTSFKYQICNDTHIPVVLSLFFTLTFFDIFTIWLRQMNNLQLTFFSFFLFYTIHMFILAQDVREHQYVIYNISYFFFSRWANILTFILTAIHCVITPDKRRT